ncbi:MAG TPA: 23S rRNA (adenine(2503)-C(2))-methyltransferase RlmN [Kofleriaceae bacterium]|jgi:23S rRNA (adenine2503-C2)-methyltransferase|nr:23S rRNA (adenine(2503)-C(2))-methyltransferase RlmN [Kofleriaceae bacterium]
MARLALQAVTPAALAAAVPAITLAEARKIVAMVHRGEPVAASSAVRRAAADAVRATGDVPTLTVRERAASAIDPFVKLVLALPDGELIETVRIPLEKPGRFTVCVSSQVGCALACAFCATGRLGLRRNLEPWEIVEQVRAVRATLGPGERVHGIVFQGMGEPMANLDRVLAAIEILTEPCAQGVDARAITVCTSGHPAGIRRLAREAKNVRLGLSIASVRPAVRRSLMPVDRAHPLDEVLAAAAEHARATGYASMWAVTLLAGVNDSIDDARALAARVHAFVAETGVRPRLSIIPYNPIGPGDPFARASDEAMAAFRATLADAGLASHRRYSGGGDIGAACGQLASASG